MSFSVVIIDSESLDKKVPIKKKRDIAILNRFKVALKMMKIHFFDYDEISEYPELDWEKNIPIYIENPDFMFSTVQLNQWLETEWKAGRYRDVFRPTFIFDSFATNQFPDLNSYRATDTNFMDYNANKLVSGEINWKMLIVLDSKNPKMLKLNTEFEVVHFKNNICEMDFLDEVDNNVVIIPDDKKYEAKMIISSSQKSSDEELSEKTETEEKLLLMGKKSSIGFKPVTLSDVQKCFDYIVANNYHNRVKGIFIYKTLIRDLALPYSPAQIKWQVEKLAYPTNFHLIEMEDEDRTMILNTFMKKSFTHRIPSPIDFSPKMRKIRDISPD